MVSVTVHIKADVLIIPGHKKKQKMKSKKVAKTQLKLIILVDNKFKEKRLNGFIKTSFVPPVDPYKGHSHTSFLDR